MEMTTAVVDRDILVETEEIKELRKLYQRWNEMRFASGGVDSLIDELLGSCDRKVYIGKEAEVYYDVLDARDFLEGKYAELSNAEAAKYKNDVEKALNEADEVLRDIRGN